MVAVYCAYCLSAYIVISVYFRVEIYDVLNEIYLFSIYKVMQRKSVTETFYKIFFAQQSRFLYSLIIHI